MRAHCQHEKLHCFLPPYILERLAESPDSDVRRLAVEAIGAAAEARTARLLLSLLPTFAAVPSPSGKKHRLVYDMRNRPTDMLPGRLARAEGERAVRDRAVNEAYNGCGHVHDFFRRVCGRNSLDDRGMTLVSSVHVGKKYNNAFWNGVQIAFGDGDGGIFRPFTRSLDVIGHELTHGVVTHTANLEYRGQSGALNEHFADVFGALIGQWKRKETAAGAEWLIGRDIMGPKVKARALRTFKAGKAFEDDPYFGTDPQPKHMDGLYTGEADRGGVHINSGIPNYAFYRIATALGGRAWERAGPIWYELLLRLNPTAGFKEAAETSLRAASDLFPRSPTVKRAVREGWKAAGVNIR